MNSLFDEFRTICSHLNQSESLRRSWGLWGLNTDQMKNGGRLTLTFNVPGDPRGWEAPDHLRIL